MKRFLVLSWQHGWIATWEFKRLIRTWRNALRDAEFDWQTPRWVARSARLSFYWGVERAAYKQPLIFMGAVILTPIAAPLGLYRLFDLLVRVVRALLGAH